MGALLARKKATNFTLNLLTVSILKKATNTESKLWGVIQDNQPLPHWQHMQVAKIGAVLP
jgi:hypothetical protein